MVKEKKERFLLGVVGALLFSLAGGVAWYLLYQVNFIAALSGIIGIICALKGYKLFAGKESIKGVVVSVIACIIVMVVAWYLCIATDIYKAYQDWKASGETWYTLTFAESLESAGLFLKNLEFADGQTVINPEKLRGEYFASLGLGMLFCVIGGFANVRDAVARVKANKAFTAQYAAAAAANNAAETVNAAEAPAVEAAPAAEAPVVEAPVVEAPAEAVEVPTVDAVEVPSVDSIEMPTVETETKAE